MHPEVIQDEPGSCPKCGMSLIPQAKKPDVELDKSASATSFAKKLRKVKKVMGDKHAGHSVAMFRDRFWLSLTLTIPVLAYSVTIQQWLNFSLPAFSGSGYIPFVLSTVIFLYGGLVFIKSALGELKGHRPGMMTLISLAISTAFIYSVAVQFGLSGQTFFWELATLITIMLLGHWLEMASIKKAQSALDAIAQLIPDKAEKLVNGRPQPVLVSQLEVGNLVLVRPGAAIPVDGQITEGSSSVNEAAISGESKPVSKTVNDEVVAGTINQDGSLTVKVTKIGEDTALAGIMRLVAEAQASKSNVQMLADKAAFALTIVAIVVGLLTFLLWTVAKDSGFALERSVTVLIIACPHALGLAIPLVVSISTTLSARNGLLIRKRLALESARSLDIVLFDKTGTLTRGEHGVTDIWPTKGYSQDDILRLAASLEQNSEHIIGKGIVKYAQEKKLLAGRVTNFSALPGLGVKGVLEDGKPYVAASRRYIEENKLVVPTAVESKIKAAAKQGKSEVYLLRGNNVIGALALADVIRDESKTAIGALRKLNIKTAMVTGDSEDVASYVASQLGLDQYFAEVKPQDKVARVKQLQAGGQKVAMVGDGINDAPALTQANIGLAIGAGTDVAIKSADIILVKSDPRDVVKVIKLSKATYSKMKQNLIWATGYNVVAIPLAAGVLYQYGIVLAPAVGAGLMSLSTIIVALNAQLLRRLHF
ncbi:heavy metal translocating P-type ATPase [Candidatus Saccharibacteria bacterium]|nr:heavy metal translocating P-type ATPase [Candidatus Saccharibacteria bacterium]